MKNSRSLKAMAVLVAAVLACNVSTTSGGDVPSEETRVAVAIQQTSLAI